MGKIGFAPTKHQALVLQTSVARYLHRLPRVAKSQGIEPCLHNQSPVQLSGILNV